MAGKRNRQSDIPARDAPAVGVLELPRQPAEGHGIEVVPNDLASGLHAESGVLEFKLSEPRVTVEQEQVVFLDRARLLVEHGPSWECAV